MAITSEEHPPSYPTTNQIKLDSGSESKIVNVSLYTGHAEITRLYKLKLLSGQNNVVLSGLPNSLKEDTIRVEGRGDAAIHDVTTFKEPDAAPSVSKDTPRALELYDQKTAIKRALKRAKGTLRGLEKYLSSLNMEHVGAEALLPTLNSYSAATAKYDEEIAALEKQIAQIDKEIEVERDRRETPDVVPYPRCLRTVTVSVSALSEGDVELILIYSVHSASWAALYDVRVTTESKEEPVALAYKASIQQDTGEDWTDVPITLETAAPTFGLKLPTINRWVLSVRKPDVRQIGYPGKAPTIIPMPQPMQMPTIIMQPQAIVRSRSRSWSRSRSRSSSSDDSSRVRGRRRYGMPDYATGVMRAPSPVPLPFVVPLADIASRGRVNASFKVPGLITIPSDRIEHKVTIANLTPVAELSWFCIPSVETKVHLTTNVKNTSEYTLLPGPSSVYVDGSFISKSSIPLVSPEESFACPLGLDPSIRVTYHPQSKKASQTGLINKTSSTSFTQRITVHNAKSIPVKGLKVVAQIPVSDDSQIIVKLVNPSLSPLATFDKEKPGTAEALGGVAVAGWYKEHDTNPGDSGFLGKDGKIAWTCALQPQEKIDLSLAWEVSAPALVEIIGL